MEVSGRRESDDRSPGAHGAPKGADSDDGHGEQGPGAASAGAPSPDASLATLDAGQLEILRRVGREWGQVCANPDVWRRALPVDPDLGSFPDPTDIRPTRFGRLVRVQRGGLPHVEASSEVDVSSSPV